jgi:uncharacterized membrane protein YfcA
MSDGGTWLLLLLIPAGFVLGAFGTLIGAGGGFLLVPVLLLAFPEESPATVTSVSLAVVFFNALSGSWAYWRQRRIDLRTGLAFAAAATPGAVIGALVVGRLSRGIFDPLFGGALVLLALLLIVRPGARSDAPVPFRQGMTKRALVDASGTRYAYNFYLWQGVILSIAVGFLSSLFGIGGGIVHVPIMVELLHFPVHIATATSHFILAIMALAGTLTHLADGNLGPEHGLNQVLLLTVGVVPGAQLGAKLSHRVQGPLIIRLLGVALLIVGVRLLLTPILR